tara:strand:+ start:343 stop:717 length:375 start_codon:yes stop_codon:yes gene_type:complete
MKTKIVMALAVVTAIACNNNEATEEPSTDIIEVANTKEPDYAEYRKQWKRTNSNLTSGYSLIDGRIVQDAVEINLDDLSFARAFRIEYLAKGEGHTFWWQGSEYTTNIAEEVQNLEVRDNDGDN